MEPSYFHSLEEQKRLLARHGFGHWPDEDELFGYLFGLEDKFDAFCKAMGFTMTRDDKSISIIGALTWHFVSKKCGLVSFAHVFLVPKMHPA